MLLLLTCLAFITIFFIEVPQLIIEKKQRELVTVCIILVIGFLMSYIQIKDIHITNPNDIIISIIEKIIPR